MRHAVQVILQAPVKWPAKLSVVIQSLGIALGIIDSFIDDENKSDDESKPK